MNDLNIPNWVNTPLNMDNIFILKSSYKKTVSYTYHQVFCLGFYLTHIVELCLSLTVSNISLQLHGNLQIKNFIKYSLKLAIYSRVMWKMESQALMWERKALPKPWPAWAPFTKPAISTTFRNAGTLLEGKVKEKWRSCHWCLGAECADNCIMQMQTCSEHLTGLWYWQRKS